MKTRKPSKRKAPKVQTTETPDLIPVETVQSAIDLLDSLVSTKQVYHIWKQAKQAASKASVPFPYVWQTQKRNMARIIRHIPREVAGEALDAAFKEQNGALCLELIRQFGVQDQEIEEITADVAQKQAFGKTVSDAVKPLPDKDSSRIDSLEAKLDKLLSALGQ